MNPLLDKYGGIKEVGGYRHFTEYEISHGIYAEAAHCILGSLHKVMVEDDERRPIRLVVEREHIGEEIGIMESVISEYMRPVYNLQLMDDIYTTTKSINSIHQASDDLLRDVDKAKSGLKYIRDLPKPVIYLTQSVYNALGTLAVRAMGINIHNCSRFNVWRDGEFTNVVLEDPRMSNVTRRLRYLYKGIYGIYPVKRGLFGR